MKTFSALAIIAIVLSAISCSERQVTEEQSMPASNMLTLPDGFSYQGRNPEMGNPENLELIIEWNNRRSNLQYVVGDLIADTLTMYAADGTELEAPRDTIVAYLQAQYDNLSSQEITINAAIPIYYSDMDHEWVYSWIFRETVFNEGNQTESYFHEDYRIIDGKIRMIYQFQRIPPTGR